MNDIRVAGPVALTNLIHMITNVLKKDRVFEIFVHSPAETQAFAEKFAAELQPGDVVALYGDLGAGKTFLVKALCRALHTEEEPTSPTFTIINEYHAPDDLLIYHFDFYRIEHAAELVNLGLEEYFYADNICFIEWPEKIVDDLPEKRFEVFLNFVESQPDARNIRVQTKEN